MAGEIPAVVKKEYVPMMKQLVREGCELRPTRKGHVLVVGPDGQRVTMSVASTSHRTMKNGMADLRRHGLLTGEEPERKEEKVAQVTLDEEARSGVVRRRVNEVLADRTGDGGLVTPAVFVDLALTEAVEQGLRLPDSDTPEKQKKSLASSLRHLRSGERNSNWLLNIWEAGLDALRELGEEGVPPKASEEPQEVPDGPEPAATPAKPTRARRTPRRSPSKGTGLDVEAARGQYVELLMEKARADGDAEAFDRLERILGFGKEDGGA